MPKRSLKYTACHEAGHAVVAYENGFTICRIQLNHDPLLDSWSGAVDYVPTNWSCSKCGRQLVEAVRGEDFATLNPDCDQCRARILSFTQRCLAGGVATEQLEPADHNPDDSDCDRIEAFKCSVSEVETRVKNYTHWLGLTRDSIHRSCHAIQTLQTSLINMPIKGDCIEMDGEIATSIIAKASIDKKTE